MRWLLAFGYVLPFLILLLTDAQAQMKKGAATKGRRPLLLVVNQGDQTLSMVDPDAGSEVAKV